MVIGTMKSYVRSPTIFRKPENKMLFLNILFRLFVIIVVVFVI